jgi:hypothetical protein
MVCGSTAGNLLAAERGRHPGVTETLYKTPMVASALYLEHDLFITLTELKNRSRCMLVGEENTTSGANTTRKTSRSRQDLLDVTVRIFVITLHE